MASTKRTRKDPASLRKSPGRTEKGVALAVRASRAGGKADPRWGGVEGLARTLGRALDQAEEARAPYAIAQLAPRLLDVLAAMRLTPDTQPGHDDELGAFLAGLAGPALRDAS